MAWSKGRCVEDEDIDNGRRMIVDRRCLGFRHMATPGNRSGSVELFGRLLPGGGEV